MKKHTEKPQIDELFARKLGNTSLRPRSDGFARLQARMDQNKPEPRMVFWRNPAMQRYMAAAACLLLVCLFGWLYWPSTGATEQSRNQLATNQSVEPTLKKPVQKGISRQQDGQRPDVSEEESLAPDVNTNQVAITDNSEKSSDTNYRKASRVSVQENPVRSSQSVPVAPMLAQERPLENKAKVEPASPTYIAPITQVPTEQVADAKPVAKPSPVTERVLVVTIAEPELWWPLVRWLKRRLRKRRPQHRTKSLPKKQKPADCGSR